MLEIGTTREPLPSQDSTKILSTFCKKQRWDFTTCDMDPDNSARAIELFAAMKVRFKAVTGKGEEFLAAQRWAWDAVYLDAYDFDHGNHSEVRQERYQTILGSRIDQHACEVMHLEAMQALTRASRPGCLVVLDDTWREEPGGPWLGKGPLAVPWALEHGWIHVFDPEGYRAVVLERSDRPTDRFVGGYYRLRRGTGLRLRLLQRRLRRG
jgi:hypothetical protein